MKNIDRPPPLASGLGPALPSVNSFALVLYVSFHTVGAAGAPCAVKCSWVPPTPVTRGSLSGHEVTRNA